MFDLKKFWQQNKNHLKTGGPRWQEDILFCREIVVDLIKNSVL